MAWDRTSVLPEVLERRRLLSGAVWDIHGDARPRKADDIVVELDPADASRVRATVNGVQVGNRALAALSQIRVHGGKGADAVSVNLGGGPKLSRVNVTVHAGAGNDAIFITGARARIFGGAGNDTINGWTGRDLLDGGAGDDSITGNGGEDTVRGGAGVDTVDGESELATATVETVVDRVWAIPFGERELQFVTPQEILPEPLDIRPVTWPVWGGPIIQPIDYIPYYPSEPLRHFDTDAAVYARLVEAAVSRWKDLFGQAVPSPKYYLDGGVLFAMDSGAMSVTANAAGTASLASAAASDVSGTNTQVANVDEADVIETDGRYLYTAVGSEVVIVSADPAGEMAVVSRTDVGGQITGLYLSENGTLTVVASAYRDATIDVGGDMVVQSVRPYRTLSRNTVVATFDVADAAAPALVEKTVIHGRVTDSRVVDGRFYGVVDSGLPLPAPRRSASDWGVYESEEEYRARLQTLLPDVQLPWFSSTSAAGEVREGSLVSAENTHVAGQVERYTGLTSVVLIDPAAGDPGADDSESVVGSAGKVYATEDSLYLTAAVRDEESGLQRTRVTKFDLSPTSVSYAAFGSVDGGILNQFSLGENSRGDLNVATTTAGWWGMTTSSNVFTLRQNGDALEVIGSLTGIAPGERITSARFTGDKAYLVTFRRVDPLFTLDLTKPSEPQLVGELKIPGFSSYLQPLDDRYVLGIGRDGTEDGVVGSLQVSLFDVLDPANPIRLHTYTFTGDRWDSFSEAEGDHHAFQYFPDRQTLAIPTRNYATGEHGTTVLKVDPASGFERLGFVAQEGARRAVRIGATLYTLGSETIVASDIADPATLFGTVQIRENDPLPCWPWLIGDPEPLVSVGTVFTIN